MIRRVDTAEDAIETYGKFRSKILNVIAQAGDGTTEKDILTLLDNREAVMFTKGDSIAIIQIVIDMDDAKRWCLVRIAAGNLSDILSGEDTVDQWALSHGATGMYLIGRKGWKRILSPIGFSNLEITTDTTDFKNLLAGKNFLHWKNYDDGFIPENNDD